MAVTGEMLTASPVEPARQRILTTLLFTDIVDSTASVVAIGDRRWGMELDLHYDMVRRHIERFDGREVKTTGDGVIAVFDGPTRGAMRVGHPERDGPTRCHRRARRCPHRRGRAARRRRARRQRPHHPTDVRPGCRRSGPRHQERRRSRHRRRTCDSTSSASISSRVSPVVGASTTRVWCPSRHRSSTRRRPAVYGRLSVLSPREREVLGAVATGASNAEVASTLSKPTSEASAKAHITHLFTKTGCANRVQLALYAHRIGLAGD